MPKILLIRFSSIGDIVLCSPVIRTLKQQLQAELHFLTKPNFASLLTSNPDLSKIHTLQDDLSITITALKAEQFDYIVDLHKNLRSKRIISSLGKPVYRFDKLNWEKWLMVNFKINRLGNQHLVDRYFEGLESLGLKNDGQGLDFYPASEKPQKVPSSLLKIGRDEPYICLVLGAAHATKQMPEELLQAIVENSPRHVVLIGGPPEAEQGKSLAKHFGKKVSNLCGQTTIAESAEVLKTSAAVISPDTGMMHISAALKVPLVAVWGNTIPQFGMYPYYPEGQKKYINIERNELLCRPCSKIGKKKCPKGHFKCMREHSAADILAAVERLIN